MIILYYLLAHTLSSLEKFGKSDLTRLVIDYQNNFDTILNNINFEPLDLKNKFTKLEPDLEKMVPGYKFVTEVLGELIVL